MPKVPVNNCASVVLIFPRSNPRKIFIQQKDKGLPNQFGQDEALCPFGGNWVGKEAIGDSGPEATLVRELDEELFVDADKGESHRPAALQGVLEAVEKTLSPYIATLAETAGSVWSTPEKPRASFVTRVSYFTAALDDDDWAVLEHLQDKYGRLSNEGNSRGTSLDEIVLRGLRGAYGHDQILQKFWLDQGFEVAEHMFIYPNPPAVEVPWLQSYDKVLAAYDVDKTPFV